MGNCMPATIQRCRKLELSIGDNSQAKALIDGAFAGTVGDTDVFTANFRVAGNTPETVGLRWLEYLP
jgi:hypothetical protein